MSEERARTGDRVMAERIRARRRALKLTQRELGALMQPPVSQRSIGAYEECMNGPRSIEALRQLAIALETTVAYLVGECEQAEES